MQIYTFSNTIVLVNGQEINEFDEGDDCISIERREDSAVDVITPDGIMVVALSANKSGVIGLRLTQTSASNLYLTTLINAQENGAFVPVIIQFKDIGGNDLASGTQGYMRKLPGLARGKGLNGQLWEIVVERLNLVIGGN